MGKYSVANTAGEGPETALEYRQFAPDFTSSSEQQRWKLLDSIAKHAPGNVQKIAERDGQFLVQPIKAQDHKVTLSPNVVAYHEQTNFKPPRDIKESLNTAPKQRSFGSLFEAYTDNKEELKSDNGSTPLKALLRQVNS